MQLAMVIIQGLLHSVLIAIAVLTAVVLGWGFWQITQRGMENGIEAMFKRRMQAAIAKRDGQRPGTASYEYWQGALEELVMVRAEWRGNGWAGAEAQARGRYLDVVG